MPIRRLFLLTTLLLSISSLVHATETLEERVFENDRIGKVRFVVPTEWQTYDRHHINFGTTVLSGTNRKEEQFEISFNDVKRMEFRWTSEAELREFIDAQMQQYVADSVERKVTLRVQPGTNRVVYATLTDRNPKPGEFKLITLGAARAEDAVFLIFHLTNDPKRVERVVSAVASAQRVPK